MVSIHQISIHSILSNIAFLGFFAGHSSRASSAILLADIDVVDVGRVLILGRHLYRGAYGWLVDRCVGDGPVEFWFVEVAHAVFGGCVGDADVDALRCQHTSSLTKDALGISSSVLAALR